MNNLNPPPDTPEELVRWAYDLYQFLQSPCWETIKFVPRADAPTAEEGRVYLDSDDHKLKCHNGTDFQDAY